MSECNISCERCGGTKGDHLFVFGTAIKFAFWVVSQQDITCEMRSACEDMILILMQLYPDHRKLQRKLKQAKELFAG